MGSTAPPAAPPVKIVAPLWMTLTFIGLLAGGLLYYGAAAAQGDHATGRAVWLLLGADCLLAAARIAWLVGLGRPRLFELTFWTFVYVFLVLAPTVQFGSGQYPGTTPAIETRLSSTVLAIVLLGNLAVLAGLTLSKTQPAGPGGGHVRDARVYVLVGFALVADAYYVHKIGPGALLAHRQTLSERVNAMWPNPTTAALVQGLSTMPLLISFGALLQLRRQRIAAGRLRPNVMTAVVLASLLLTVNPISSARYYFGTVLLSIAAMVGAYSTPRRVRLAAVGFVVALVVVFPAADVFRYTNTTGVGKGGPVVAMTSGDYDAVDQISNAALYVSDRGTVDGRQALGPALFWVPRSIWPDKPVDTGVLLARYRGYLFQNLSAPLWAELYLNGAWPALLLGMGLLGYGIRRADERIEAASEDGGRPPVLLCVLPFYLMILLRGSLLQASAILAVLLVAGLWVTDRRQAGPVRPS